MKILFIDDEIEILQSYQRYFRDQVSNYDLNFEQDSSKALELITKNQYDVIISDLRMPKVSGIDILKKVKELSLETKVMLVTGAPTIETVVEVMNLGAWDYLLKPVQYPELESKLEILYKNYVSRDEVEEFNLTVDMMTLSANRVRHLLNEKLHIASVCLDEIKENLNSDFSANKKISNIKASLDKFNK